MQFRCSDPSKTRTRNPGQWIDESQNDKIFKKSRKLDVTDLSIDLSFDLQVSVQKDKVQLPLRATKQFPQYFLEGEFDLKENRNIKNAATIFCGGFDIQKLEEENKMQDPIRACWNSINKESTIYYGIEKRGKGTHHAVGVELLNEKSEYFLKLSMEKLFFDEMGGINEQLQIDLIPILNPVTRRPFMGLYIIKVIVPGNPKPGYPPCVSYAPKNQSKAKHVQEYVVVIENQQIQCHILEQNLIEWFNKRIQDSEK